MVGEIVEGGTFVHVRSFVTSQQRAGGGALAGAIVAQLAPPTRRPDRPLDVRSLITLRDPVRRLP